MVCLGIDCSDVVGTSSGTIVGSVAGVVESLDLLWVKLHRSSGWCFSGG